MECQKHISESDIDFFLSKDDADRKGIESSLNGIGNRKCSECTRDLFFFDLFFDYFLENLEIRKIDKGVLDFYRHTYNGLAVIHCFYNPEIKKYRDMNPSLNFTSLQSHQFQEDKAIVCKQS